ncbi:MAG: hypothetical protein PHG80_11955 [Methanoregulaceae archaeon]|nr:hypothetical protein [Methanoregulaceae archaeon]
MALGAIVVAAGVIAFALNSQFSALQTSNLPQGGLSVTTFYTDQQGVIGSWVSGGYKTHPPMIVRFDAEEGDRGHVAVGAFNLVRDLGQTDYSQVGIRVELLKAEVTTDVGLIRLGLATAWIDKVTIGMDGKLKHWYLEFDIWNSPVMNSALVLSTVYWAEDGEDTGMPTVLVKSHQLAVGEETCLVIDIEKGFEKAYPGLDLYLDDCYFVVEKSDATSEFEVELAVKEMRLYR